MESWRSADHVLQVCWNMIHIHRTTYSNIYVTLPKMLTQPLPKVWLPNGIAPLAMQQQGCPTPHVLHVSLHFCIVVCDLLFYVSRHFPFHWCFQVTISGVLRGSGRQYVGAITNFVCYNVIGLPLGVVLAFKASMGTIGLWTGLAVGNIIQVCDVVMYCHLLSFTVIYCHLLWFIVLLQSNYCDLAAILYTAAGHFIFHHNASNKLAERVTKGE